MKKYFSILAVAMTVMACSNNDEIPQAPNDVEPTTEEQESVGGEPFGYAPSFVLSKSIELSEQNCAVVRSKEEMAGIELTTKELPNVDFTKDNLVVGVIRIPNSGFGVTKVDLKEQDGAYRLDVYIKKYDSGFDMAGWLCYWNVFPKLADKPIDVNLLNVDGSKFPWAQDKYVDETVSD